MPDPDLEAGRQPQIQMVSSGVGGPQTESTSPPVDPSQPQRRQLELVPIPRVRGLLRCAASDQFTPQIVPIGPYHVDQVGSYLLQSTGVKDKDVQHIIEKQGVDLAGLKAVVCNLVNDVRPCYTHLPEDTMNNPQAFSKMLLLDGCYLLCRLIEFHRPGAGSSSSGGGGTSSSGASGSNGGGGSSNGGSGGGGSGSGSRSGDVGGDIAANQMRLDNDNTLVRDILYLLENQIHLPVLEAILNYIKGTENIHYAPGLIYGPVRDVLQKQKYISTNRQPVPSTSMSKPSDLLHLVYSYFRRGPDDARPGSAQACCLKSTGRWRRATDYRKYADLKFRCREFQEGQQWTILDMHIEGGTLYIPFLQVNPDTWTMLRNLMALEEQEKERPVTAYCFFMSQVACTAEDVQLLQGAGILQHFMPNDKEAANAFAYLCGGVAMDVNSLERNYLKSVWHHLDKRCNKQVHNFKGFFRDKYCSTVFYRLVFFVAILVFVSEVTQAIYAVIAYHKPTRS